MEYGAVGLTMNRSKESKKHLILAERRALRAVLGVGKRTRIRELYESTGLQPLEERLIELREKAISRFDGNSKSLQDLKILKQIILGV